VFAESYPILPRTPIAKSGRQLNPTSALIWSCISYDNANSESGLSDSRFGIGLTFGATPFALQQGRSMVTADLQSSNDKPKQSTKPSVFVSYPFDARDEWIKYCVPSLLRLYGCHVLSGAKYPGQEINVAVTNDIARSNLLVAFLTRNQQLANGKWVPSEWVLQEIGFARGKGIPVVLVREQGVYTEIGIVGNIQVIDLDADGEAFWAFPQLRTAVRNLLFGGHSEDGLAVCHLAKRGRKDHWNKQWWDFWLWIDGCEDSLDSIAEVKYEFPQSFVPKYEEGDRHRAFGDYAETDAPVVVKAKIRFKSGKKKTVKHKVVLPGTGISQIG
jgi:hypothetical protein